MIRTSLLSAVAAFALASCATSEQLDDTGAPVAWVVSDADSEMILFPTVHALPEDLNWRTARLDALMASADEVWFELGRTDDPAIVAEIQQLMGRQGLSPEAPLSSRLDAAQFARLTDAAEALRLPIEQLDPLQPWLAAMTLVQVDLARAGITGEQGVESVLTTELAEREARSLETPADQIRVLSGLDEAIQIAFLMQSVDGIGEAAERLDKIARSWAAGDLDLMETELIDEVRLDYPDVFEAIFTDRNAKWADQLTAELEGSGSDFIAVGAGHLIGDDSVPDMLAERGYEVTRISLADGGR